MCEQYSIECLNVSLGSWLLVLYMTVKCILRS
uniref:Uncharacterized protein n=1 Tax=Leersia perrieri TaxID=77586 RepID=A0A0D9VFW1_9ORYZ